MARPRKHDGVVYKRNDSNFWWMRYRDKTGRRCLESTNTTDWDDAQRQLRERLQARDNNTLEFLHKGKQLTFNEWGIFFWSTTPSHRFGLRRRTWLMRRR